MLNQFTINALHQALKDAAEGQALALAVANTRAICYEIADLRNAVLRVGDRLTQILTLLRERDLERRAANTPPAKTSTPNST
jgi:hypothetical protein